MLFAARPIQKTIKKVDLRIERRGRRFAIIDLGTNSIRFDIYELQPKRLVRLYRDKKMVRLGDGVFSTGKLNSSGKLRVIKVLKEFVRILRQHKVRTVTAVATSAMRSASNGKEFAREIETKTGIKFKIISGREESVYISRGILSHVRMPDDLCALIDIGGGSTEVTLCRKTKIIKQASLALGANRLHQIFLKESPPRLRGQALSPDLALRQHLRLELRILKKWMAGKKCTHVIGSSGTIRNLGKILRRSGSKSQPFRRRDLSGLVGEMRIMSRKELAELPGVEPKRIDLLLAGAILFEEILFAISANKFYVTDLALRDGLLLSELEKWI